MQVRIPLGAFFIEIVLPMTILKENTNKIFYFFYDLALWLAFCVLILTPIHKAATRHCNIDQVLSPTSVAFSTQDTSFIVPGDSFPVYRFNPDWTSEIGWVKVTSVGDNEVTTSFNPNEFRWPMGRQGQFGDIDGPMGRVTMGSDLGFKTGDVLCLYKNRDLVGKVQLQDIYPDHSSAQILSIKPGIDPEGLTASEFIFVTQVSFLKNPFVIFLEILLLAGVILGPLLFFSLLAKHLYSPFWANGSGIKARLYRENLCIGQ